MDAQQPGLSAEALEAIFEAKARAELEDADTAAHAGADDRRGEAGARLMAIVSAASPGDVHAAPLSGEAAVAFDKAIAAFGLGPDDLCVVGSRPKRATAAGRERRLKLAIEAIDPRIVMALDQGAAVDLATALGIAALDAGLPVRVLGRVCGYAGDFAGSLGDDAAKARVWAGIKRIAAEAGLKAKGRPKAPR